MIKPDSMLSEFRRRFWLPPRAHGDVIEDRTVSFLELFYDLVYVVVISRAAHSLAEQITWRRVGEFVVVFGLIWLAWLNGTLYYELHGREDGRTRAFVFIQMLLLALLAVFTAGAASDSGTQFAIVYALYLAVVSWLWYTVRLQDSEEYMAVTARYLAGMVVSVVLVAISAFVPGEARLWIWVSVILMWVVASYVLSGSGPSDSGIVVTDSMVERFGLIVIIVLGEVVVGVVDGLSEIERTVKSVSTGLLGLCVGFAYWWTYFDFVGRRRPVGSAQGRTTWMFTHLPVTMSIAAAGAAMVSLIEHSSDEHTPAATAWLIGGSVALGLLGLVVTMRTLRDFDRLPTVYRPVSQVMVVAMVVALLTALWAPAPWLLALSQVAILLGVWLFAVDRWLRLPDPDTIAPQGG